MPKTVDFYDPRSIGNAGGLAWSASGQSSLLIGARAFVLSGLDLTFEVDTYDSSPVPQQDYFMRMVQSISLTGDGKNYLMISGPDARSLYWHHRLRTQGRDRIPDYAHGGSSGASALHQRYNIPLMLTPHPVKFDDQPNFFGQKAGIVTSDDLTLAINWNTAAIWGTGSSITIQNAYCTVNYFGYVPGSDADKPTMYPMWVSQNFVPPSAQPSLGFQMPVPTGNWWYRRTSIMFLTGVVPADVRTNGLTKNVANVATSEIGYTTADGRNPIKLKVQDFAAQSQTQFSVADDNTGNAAGAAAAYGAAVVSQRVNPGVGLIDWAQTADLGDKANANADFGINAANKDSTSLNISATVDVATNTAINLLHERYAPY